jgi:sulfoxide reductase catalytic subunit YedY
MRFIDKTILPGDITPQAVFENRRNLIKAAAVGSFGMALAPWFSREALAANPEKLSAVLNQAYASKDGLTPDKYVKGCAN